MTDRLGRVAELVESSGGSNTTLVNYSYMGSGQLVSKHYLEPNLIRSTALVTGNDPYSLLDRFGRLTGLTWLKDGLPQVRFAYRYDRNGNRLSERNTILIPQNKRVDCLHKYDSLNRLKESQIGALNTSSTGMNVTQLKQNWTLDETGNYSHVVNRNALAAGQPLTTILDQTRTHNTVNEITGIDETIGPVWATPQHDAAGNMTAIPQPINLTKNFTAIWDAWNRLVELRENRLQTPVDPQSGDPIENTDPVFVDRIITRYEYDSVNRRIVIQEYSQESGEKSDKNEVKTPLRSELAIFITPTVGS